MSNPKAPRDMSWSERWSASRGRYVLQGTEPVPEPDLLAWGEWFETADRIVKQTKVAPEIWVSSVFLGLDHNFWGRGAPVLFETMVFGGPLHGEQERYTTWFAAEQGHERMLARVCKSMGLGEGSFGDTSERN